MEENLIYFIDGQTFEVHPSRKQEFENDNPSATQVFKDEEGKLFSKSQRALLEEKEARLVNNGVLESRSDLISLDLSEIEKPKTDLSGKIITPELTEKEEKKFKKAFETLALPLKTPISELDEKSRKEYDDYIKLTNEFSFLNRLEEAQIESAEKGDDFVSKTINGLLINPILQIEQFVPNLKISALSFAQQILSDDHIEFVYGKKGLEEEKKSKIGQLRKKASEAVDNATLKAVQDFQILSAKYGKTGSITEGGKDFFGKGDLNGLGEIIAGVANAVGSFGASALISAPTFGVGIYTDFYGRSFVNVNEARANKLGITLEELIKNQQEDYRGPLILGGISGALERIGIKGVNKSIAQSTKAGYGQSILLRGSAGTKEGVTEYLQTGVEAIEEAYGAGKSAEQIGEAFVNKLLSQEGLESFLQGFTGGALIGGKPRKEDVATAASLISLATLGADGVVLAGGLTPMAINLAAYRMRSPANKKEHEALLQEIHDLKQEFAETSDVELKKTIQLAIENRQKNIKELIKQDNIIINQTSEQDLNKLSKIKDLSIEFNNKFKNLKQKFDNNEISLKEYQLQQKLIKQEFENQKKNLNEIISDISLKNKNISDKNTELIKIIKENKNPAAVEKAKNDLVENNKGFIEKLIKTTFNPTLNTELTEADYRAAINLEFAKIINTYKIKENVPFGAYLQQNLPKRLPAIFDLAIETTPEGEMVAKTDVTQEKNIIDDIDLNLEAATPEISNKILSKTGITEQDINNKSKEILKSRLPGLNEKIARDQNPFLTAIEKAAEGKFFETIYKKLGGNYNNKNKTEWEAWLDENIDDFLQLIEESGNKDYNRIKNKMLRGLYKGVKVGRAKKGEGGTNIGEGRYEYQTPTKQEAIDYFTKGGLTTLVERKKTLTKILSHAVGKKGVANVINDADVQQDFIEIQKLLGKDIPQNLVARITTALDRVIKHIENTTDKNTLQMDLTFGLLSNARSIVLKFLKSLRKYLAKKGWAEARAQAIKDLGIKNLNDFKLVNDVLSDVNESDIQTAEGIEKIIEKFKEAIKKDRIPPVLIENRIPKLIEKINSAKDPSSKISILKDFFSGHTKTFTKAGSTYKNELKNKYNIEISSNEGFLNFIKSKFKNESWLADFKIGKGKSIYYKNENLSSIKYNLNNQPRIDLVDGKIDPKEINERSLKNKEILLKELDIYKEKGDLEGAFNMLSAMQEDQNTPLRLYPNLNIVFKPFPGYKEKNALVVEHNPPTDSQIAKFMEYVKGDITRAELIQYMNDAKMNIVSKKFDDEIPTEFKSKADKNRYKHIENYKKGEDYIVYNNEQQQRNEFFNKKDLNKEFNQILEDKTGIKAESEFKDVKGRRAFDVKKRFRLANIFVPYTAEDLNGLMYALLPKGKKGDAAYKWIKENIYDPFSLATENISRARMAMMNDFEALKKELNTVPATLKEKVGKGFFTKEDAVRVWIWTRQGMEIPGLSKADAKELLNVVKNDTTLQEFASKLININKGDGYIKPDSVWDAGTITTDLLQNINEVKRAKYLEQWQNNVDTIFNEATKNKLRAIYGDKYVDSLNDILKRMKSGRNRLPGGNKQVDSWLDWLNNSVGAIMFLNIRSAVLQTISTVNYMNWHDNNPLKAAKAFANQPQFWSDFMMLFNSDYLVERRGGLKLNVQESEIADMAKKKGVKGVISYLLNKGFVLTRMADSFAIANGGAAMYRNRVNTYLKEGKTQQEAEAQAFQDFRELTEESQQSSRPDRISMEQASSFGRVFLAFANTPMQYTRLMKRAAEDLVAGRGDKKTNISKLVYYGAVQNFIFNALQQALFALGFDDDEEEEKIKEKYTNTVNGMLDSILRGTGMVGNAVMVGKNFAIDIAKRANKPKPNFQDAAWKLLDMSPPLDSKVTKIRSALYTLEYEGDKMLEEGVNLNNPAAMASAQVISATTNVPMDRALRIYDNIRGAVAEDTETWQRIALLLGWSTWELGINNKDEVKLSTSGIKRRTKKIPTRNKTIKKR